MIRRVLSLALLAVSLLAGGYTIKESPQFKSEKERGMEYLLKNAKSQNSKLYNEIEEIKQKIKERKYAIFLFASSNLPSIVIKDFINSAQNHYYDIDAVIVYKELNKKIFQKINSINQEFFDKNVSFVPDTIFNPKFFREEKINVSPVLYFSVCKHNKQPDECESLFRISGIGNIDFFLQKIIKYDKSFAYLMERD